MPAGTKVAERLSLAQPSALCFWNAPRSERGSIRGPIVDSATPSGPPGKRENNRVSKSYGGSCMFFGREASGGACHHGIHDPIPGLSPTGFNSPDALTHFGHALHTVQDGTSPEHSGYQRWSCLLCMQAYRHKRAEDRSSQSNDSLDTEARYQAMVQSSQLWLRYQALLRDARKKEEKKRKEQEQNQ